MTRIELLHRALEVWVDRLRMWRSPEDIDLCQWAISDLASQINTALAATSV